MTIIHDRLDDTWIDIVSKVFLELSPITIHDEKSIDKGQRKRYDTHRQKDGKEVHNDISVMIEDSSEPDEKECEDESKYRRKVFREYKISNNR